MKQPVFYMNYNLNPQANPWRDAIGTAVKYLKGVEYTISPSPGPVLLLDGDHRPYSKIKVRENAGIERVLAITCGHSPSHCSSLPLLFRHLPRNSARLKTWRRTSRHPKLSCMRMLEAGHVKTGRRRLRSRERRWPHRDHGGAEVRRARGRRRDHAGPVPQSDPADRRWGWRTASRMMEDSRCSAWTSARRRW